MPVFMYWQDSRLMRDWLSTAVRAWVGGGSTNPHVWVGKQVNGWVNRYYHMRTFDYEL